MSNWIISSNNEYYFRLDDLLKTTNQVDWRDYGYHFAVGDIVYVYSSGTQHRIKYRFEIIKVGISGKEYLNDRQYFVKEKDYVYAISHYTFFRIELGQTLNDNVSKSLMIDLRENLNFRAPQSPIRNIRPDILNSIQAVFDINRETK